MSPLTSLVCGFLVLWTLLYIAAYMIFLHGGDTSTSSAGNGIMINNKIDPNKLDTRQFINSYSNNNNNNNNSSNSNSNKVYTKLDNPFLTEECEQKISSLYYDNVKISSTAVIIPVRNEAKDDVLRTVKSVISNSGHELASIIVVDDSSTYPVMLWTEWKDPVMTQYVKIIRTPHRRGVAGAKKVGVDNAGSVDVVVFLDAQTVVSKNWLYSLVGLLDKHPHSIVYPMIDVIDSKSGDMIKAHNMVGAFEWSLGFRWEPVETANAKSRMPLLHENVGPDDVVSSPATPGIFAIKKYYYDQIGGIDTSLQHWGHENIEISLRVWMCGGAVIRQPCSRVANRFTNLYEDAPVANGVTQNVVDRNVMNLAEHWFEPYHKEIVYRARFKDRIPYYVITSPDAHQPKQLHGAIDITSGNCLTSSWYLDQIYPGLKSEIESVNNQFKDHIGSNYLEEMLAPILAQYSKSKTDAVPNIPEIERIHKLAQSDAELAIEKLHNRLEPNAIPGRKPIWQRNMRGGVKTIENPVVKIEKSPETDEHEKHANKIRESLMCIDENISNQGWGLSCADRSKNNGCTSNKAYMMFGCPKTCDFCDAGGKLCVDFYEQKCMQWKAEGKCESDKLNMHHNCRVSCGICQPAKGGSSSSVKLQLAPKADSKITVVSAVDPFTAQKQYAAGLLPDDVGNTNACQFNGKPHGQLLQRITLASSSNEPKIFCGIYTYEKNHETNVKATKETWAKRCSGFVAFSTANDPKIPAVKIEHEGPEEYENMWQKSREIWKYIDTHFRDQFDYFLLGGDDMFYIIENLVHYLGSEEIKTLRDKNDGIFIGRRFFPPKQEVFNSGGAGYILDKKALKILGENIDSPKCYAHQKGFWEDVNVAHCLRVSAKIEPYDTRDPQERERFHPFSPGQHLTYRIPKNPDWYPQYNPYLKEGYDCCSPESISFHYCPEPLLRDLYTYTYVCKNKT